ncbi:hypothetical protein MUP46_02780 [Patescibacteria group bacterium]|nr:hypothetical protein [Patescibacteria group bacterium]
MRKSWIVIITTFSLLTFLLAASILFRIGPASTFYTIDPDVPYLSNSLLYVSAKRIVFYVHPGTPTILLFSYVLLPLGLYTHFILGVHFIAWVFENVQYIYHLIRYFQAFLLSLSVGIFLLSIFKSTKSKIAIILAWLSLYIFSQFPYFGTSLVPETLSFFLVSLWLLIFSFFVESRSPITLIFMSFLAGIALANKFTNFPVTFITIALVFTLNGLKNKQKIYNLIFSGFVIAAGFLISTWPIRHTYPQLLKWVTTLASTTGIQGGGKKALFDLGSYLISIKSLISREKFPFLLIIVSVLAVGVRIATGKLKIISPLVMTAIGTVISLAIFSKYPLNYYQLANYVLAVYMACVVLNKLPNVIKVAFAIVLIPVVLTNIRLNYSNILLASQKEAVLEQYIVSHPPASAVVWEWGRTKDFSLLWAREHAGMFIKEIALYKPNLYQLRYTLNTIILGNGQEVGVFDACWDQLYIQRSSSVLFLEKYKNRSLKFESIPGTDDMGIIKSSHCIGNNDK